MALKHARAGEVVNLRAPDEDQVAGRTAALVKTSAFEAVRLVVPAGTELPPHKVAGSITLLGLEEHAQLGTDEAIVDLRAGDWVYLDGGQLHWVRGIETASLLLTIFVAGPPAARS